EANLDEITVYHLPPQVYPTASITLDHTFPEKGKFVGLVTVTGGAETYVSRFPFSVGEGRKNSFMTTVLPGIVIVAAGAFFFMRSRRKPNVTADS
ncbi:MAG: hypothetical protein Q8K59_03855, partial [Nitrosomonas sp.]|nr:hypothetical protein [Nitrosomonas sp.]MDP1950223.1 hypothetical protein [Nitrosomonas sp.]